MNKWAFVAFAALMWILPALIAGALGWPGIWGGGTAFSDLIIPAPITGGIFHVPSFVIALAIVKAYPTFTEQSAAVARAVLISALVLGLLQLIDLERLVQVITTDVGGRMFRMEHSYVGLCMASDAIVALSWTMRFPQERQGWLMTSLIILVPSAWYVMSDFSGIERVQEPFQYGRGDFGETRGDEVLWIYTRMRPNDPAFREQALDYVREFRPEQRSNAEDVAVYFTDSLRAARRPEEDRVLATLCLFEDGSADTWHDGKGDCFTEHESFTEAYGARANELSDSVPADVAAYLMFNEFCDGVLVPEDYHGGNERLDLCAHTDIEERRKTLEKSYGTDELERMLTAF